MTAAAPPGPRRGVTRFATFRPLRHRSFALVWSAALVSNIGTWMQAVAVGTLVTEVTGEARWAGFIAAAGFVPTGILGPVGGALADRVDRRRILIVTTAGETVLAAVLAAVYMAGHATPGTVLLLVLAGGAMTAIGFPSYQAMLPDLVGREDLLGAVSLSSAQFNLGRVVGPALAGLVIHFGSYGAAFVANAVSFGAVIVALLAVRVRSTGDGGDEGLWTRIRDGVRGVRADRGSSTALGIAGVMALSASPFIALIPAMAVVRFEGDAGTTAVLVTAQGVGAVTGALLLAPLAERFGRRRALVANLLLLPASLVVYAAAPTLTTAAAALAVVGAVYLSVLSGLNVVIQLRAPDAMRARAVSLYFVVIGVVYPVGAALQGRVADAVGLRLTTAVGALAMLAAVVALAVLRPARLGALEDPAA